MVETILPITPPRLGADCWILAGPTAAGKTALAIALAGRLDAEIVSVDSMAVYRGLDIGTAKPTPEERAAVPHHCLDLVGPVEPFNVAMWLAAVHDAVAAIRRRGRRVLFVGGTPLYLRSLRDGLAAVPADAPAIRRRLTEEAMQLGSPSLHARLASLDPLAAARIHPHDAKRIVRALEVVEVSGRPLSESWRDGVSPTGNAVSAAFASQMLVIDLPRQLLHDRIDRRVERMFAGGLVEETRAAIEDGGIGPTARQAAGYGEAMEVLEGRLSPSAAIERTKARTRQLAKRQLTWLRSFKDAIWIGG
jgi:tRNA dimethylallyltransferase